jgi:hypothetical protein
MMCSSAMGQVVLERTGATGEVWSIASKVKADVRPENA